MQSLYSVIKNPGKDKIAEKIIDTKYINPNLIVECEEDIIVEEPKMDIKEVEILAETIIKNARLKAETMMAEVIKKSAIIEKEAYDKGYEQGLTNGYEDGYKNGEETVLKDLEEKVKVTIESAENVVSKAEDDYKNYMNKKKEIIERTIFALAKKMAFKEIRKDEWINSLLYTLLEDFKGEENIIIKVNETHLDDINSKLEEFKGLYNLKGEVFVIKDMRMNPGNVVIEKNTGKVEVGFDIALKEIEKIFSREIEAQND